MKVVPYAFTVGNLMYVMLCTRPNICFFIGIVSRYLSNPSIKHWTTVKHIDSFPIGVSTDSCSLNGP